jgi:hypothetical protein
MHLNSELLFDKYARKYFRNGQRVLEVGPNGYPSYYRRMINVPNIEWHTLDIGSAHIEGGEQNPTHIVSSSEYDYPISDNMYDLIVSGQVMEHVKKIWTWMKELKRITKKSGFIIIIVPVSWSYHEMPIDCWRIYPDGMRALAEDCGLTVVECKMESLERTYIPPSTPTFPGNETINTQRKINRRTQAIFKFNTVASKLPLMKKLRISVPVAYDTICICRND